VAGAITNLASRKVVFSDLIHAANRAFLPAGVQWRPLIAHVEANYPTTKRGKTASAPWCRLPNHDTDWIA